MTVQHPTATIEEAAYPMWRHDDPEIVHLGGPQRVYDNDPTPEFRRPVGFTADLAAVLRDDGTLVTASADPVMPLLWDGDQA